MITIPPIGQMKSCLKLLKNINSHRRHNFQEHLQVRVDDFKQDFIWPNSKWGCYHLVLQNYIF